MNQDSLSADDIALFLQDNPKFFQEHAELFSSLRVPHPHETRAISLGERQIMTLRARAKELEWQLSGLVNNANGNEKTSRTLTEWCCEMLAEADAAQMPARITRGLADLFSLPATAIRIWGLADVHAAEITSGISDAVKSYAETLSKPYCGPLQGLENQEPAQWLDVPPASLAIIPLRCATNQTPLGLLVLGSDDPERFLADMETDFLETIGALASASLGRLAGASGQIRA
jgi:uncharacterized protein YigA (DUF484 family)